MPLALVYADATATARHKCVFLSSSDDDDDSGLLCWPTSTMSWPYQKPKPVLDVWFCRLVNTVLQV